METGNTQKELFEFEQPKKTFQKFSGIFPKSDFEGYRTLSLTLEKLVLISIGVIMLMIIMYAIGVERGKSIKKTLPERAVAASAPQPALRTPEKQLAAAIPVTPQRISAAASMITEPQVTGEKMAAAQSPVTLKQIAELQARLAAATVPTAADVLDKTKPYTIVTATFRNRDIALLESDRLKKEGFDAFLIQSDSYFQVCVGGYATKDLATQALRAIQRKYRDAYLRTK